MHAIIRQGDGKNYVSAVFGVYLGSDETDDSGRIIQKDDNPYWIVWNAEKTRLIRWFSMVPDTKYLIKQILIVDSDQDNWNTDEDGVGCVDFLSRELLDSILDEEYQPEEILKKCREMDAGYVYSDVREIRSPKDISDLEWISGGFHDARIAKEELQDEDTLYLLFDGIWGCKIEVWFSGDLEYDTSSRAPGTDDPYWFGATVIMQDGFVYLADEEDMTVDSITKGDCYIRARQVKYRIIPD